MQTSRKLILAIFAVAISGLLGAPTEAQQPAKSGKYTGKIIYHVVPGAGQTYELEKGHVFFLGPAHGVFLNDVANGFLDRTEFVCPLVQDIVGGLVIVGHGYCIMTDKDGDKAFFVFQAAKQTSPGPEAALSNGPVAPGSIPAFRETTLSMIPRRTILAKRGPG
jgi:hypothetical protein